MGNSSSTSKSVLIAVDGSEHSRQAFDWYMNNCKESKVDKHIIHHTLCPGTQTSGAEFIGILPLDQDALKRQMENLKQEANRLSHEFLGKCRDRGVRCEWHPTVGEASSSIIAAVQHHNADMVVVGSRGLNLVRRTILGSVSNYVLNHSPVPVMVIPIRAVEADEASDLALGVAN